jgi:hypothetical protein
VDVSKIVPVPGWGEGFMFGLYNKLGLTDYSSTRIPIGDPNLLKESTTRDIEQQGLISKISFKLETSYEQKYIGGLDPTAALMNIIQNLLRMGTSDMAFLGKLGNKYVQMLKTANNDPTNPSGWVTLIVSIVSGVIDTLKQSIKDAGDSLKTFMGANQPPTTTTGTTPPKPPEGDEAKKADGQKKLNILTNTLDALDGLIRSVLASTVARYQYPIRGAIAQMTGESSTPWHLTIGNPYAPILSMNNIIVKDVNIKAPNQLSFNDMPKNLNVTIDISQGRSLGKQEIMKIIGVEYQRKYKKVK